MKFFRILLAAVITTALAGCTTSTEPRATASQSQSPSVIAAPVKSPFVATPAVEVFSLIKYPDGGIVVFILVDEAGLEAVKNQIAATSAKRPDGVSLTRDEAVQILGSEKADSLDALLSGEKKEANYWLSTKDKVTPLRHEL